MRRKFLITGVSLLIIVGFSLKHLGCGLFETYTIKVTNDTGALASFGIDDEVEKIYANGYLEISNVSPGEHVWAAAWQNWLGIVVTDAGTIDVQDDMTIRIRTSGVQM